MHVSIKGTIKVINLYKCDQTKGLNPLLKNIPTGPSNFFSSQNKLTGKYGSSDHYEIKINLESIHYTGENYGYGWTFVISTLQHHWISTQIQLQHGGKSFINKDVYHANVETDFYLLQHLPITFCVQHASGFKAETTLHLNPNSFKQTTAPKSIYTGQENAERGFHFHELLTLVQHKTEFIFILNFEITPKNTNIFRN